MNTRNKNKKRGGGCNLDLFSTSLLILYFSNNEHKRQIKERGGGVEFAIILYRSDTRQANGGGALITSEKSLLSVGL